MPDKLNEIFSTRITAAMKFEMDKHCTPEDMVKLHHRVRLIIAQYLHTKKFNPADYGLNSIVDNSES